MYVYSQMAQFMKSVCSNFSVHSIVDVNVFIKLVIEYLLKKRCKRCKLQVKITSQKQKISVYMKKLYEIYKLSMHRHLSFSVSRKKFFQNLQFLSCRLFSKHFQRNHVRFSFEIESYRVEFRWLHSVFLRFQMFLYCYLLYLPYQANSRLCWLLANAGEKQKWVIEEKMIWCVNRFQRVKSKTV